MKIKQRARDMCIYTYVPIYSGIVTIIQMRYIEIYLYKSRK